MSTPRELPLLSDHVRFVWRHRVLVGVLAVIGVVVGSAWAATQETAYAATASVALTPVPKYVLPTGVGLLPPEVSIDTDAQLLNSPEVLDGVGAALGVPADAAMQQLAVTATANSRVLHVTVRASSPDAAAAAANAAIDGLARARRDSLGSLRLDQLRLLRLWTAGQEKLLAQAQSRRVVIPDTEDLFATVLDLQTSLRELEEARARPVTVLDRAVPPSRSVRSNVEVPLVSGLMLGALLGCLVAAAREHDHAHRRRRAGTAALATFVHLRPSVQTSQG